MKRGIKQEKIKVAINMINRNMDIKVISELTDLSIDEIKKLKSKYEHGC